MNSTKAIGRKAFGGLAGILALSSTFLNYNAALSELPEPIEPTNAPTNNLYLSQPRLEENITPRGTTNKVIVVDVSNTKIGNYYSLLSVEALPALPYSIGNLENMLKTNITTQATSTNLSFALPYNSDALKNFYLVVEH